MKRLGSSLTVIAVAVALTAAALMINNSTTRAGGPDERPFKGSTVGTTVFHPPINNARCAELGLIGAPVCVELSGVTHATHVGKAQFQAAFWPGPQIVNLGDCSPQVGTGKAKWTAADGSQLIMDIVANENCVIEDGAPDT